MAAKAPGEIVLTKLWFVPVRQGRAGKRRRGFPWPCGADALLQIKPLNNSNKKQLFVPPASLVRPPMDKHAER